MACISPIAGRLSGLCIGVGSLLWALGLGGCAGPAWSYTAGSAFRQARETGRPVLVYYRSAACQYCAKMDREVLTDPKVLERLGDFILLQRDFGLWRREAEELGITGTPGFVVRRPNGSVVGTPAVGEMSPAEFRAFLAFARWQR